MAGYSPADEEMKIRDGLTLHEHRKESFGYTVR